MHVFQKEGHITGHSKAEREVHPAESLSYSTTQLLLFRVVAFHYDKKPKKKEIITAL